MFANGDNNSGKITIRDSFEQTSQSFEQTSQSFEQTSQLFEQTSQSFEQTSQSFEQTSKKHFIDGTLKQINDERISKIANIDLNHQVRQMVEKSDGVI